MCSAKKSHDANVATMVAVQQNKKIMFKKDNHCASGKLHNLNREDLPFV